MPGRKKISTKERFMEKVAVREDGCWYWTAYCMKSGYGMFRFPKGHQLAHRVSYALFNGPLDDRLDVMHSCDVPCRVNPAHLTLGTRTGNMQDAVSKNRMRRGDKHGRSKLSEQEAIAILNDPRSQKYIAKEFNVSQATVSDIKVGRKWAHLHARSFN